MKQKKKRERKYIFINHRAIRKLSHQYNRQCSKSFFQAFDACVKNKILSAFNADRKIRLIDAHVHFSFGILNGGKK